MFKLIILGTLVGGGYLWWKGGGLAASDPLTAIKAGWDATTAGLGNPHAPCSGCGGGSGVSTAGAGPQAIQVGA